MNQIGVDEYISMITAWHRDRNLIDGSTDKDQALKLIQEMGELSMGELSDNVCKGKPIADDIGDIIVVLINLAERNGLTIRECLATAYEDIRHRKGMMVNGIWVKENDL